MAKVDCRHRFHNWIWPIAYPYALPVVCRIMKNGYINLSETGILSHSTRAKTYYSTDNLHNDTKAEMNRRFAEQKAEMKEIKELLQRDR